MKRRIEAVSCCVWSTKPFDRGVPEADRDHPAHRRFRGQPAPQAYRCRLSQPIKAIVGGFIATGDEQATPLAENAAAIKSTLRALRASIVAGSAP